MKYIVSAQLKNWGTYHAEIEADTPEEAEAIYRAGARWEIISSVDVRTPEQQAIRNANRRKWAEEADE